MVAHVAGMVDLVALPVWVGTLVQHHGLGPQQAGALVTLFLVGVVVASVVMSPRFIRLQQRGLVAAGGYALAALAFFLASTSRDFGILAASHTLAGLGVGCGLSMVHGAMGRSANPHRLFGIAGFAVGVLGVAFFMLVPKLIAEHGGSALFLVISALMVLAVLTTGLAFPAVPIEAQTAASPAAMKLPRPVWFVIGAVVLLTLNQALMFSFVERIGMAKGLSADQVTGVLIVTGLTNLVPGLLASALQRLIEPRWAGVIAAVGQAMLAILITQSSTFEAYAFAVPAYVFLIIFSHTFLFGLLAQLDRSGRAAASTSAMVMSGSAIGPFLGGTLVALSGYPAIGWAVTAVAALAVLMLLRAGAPAPGSVSTDRTQIPA